MSGFADTVLALAGLVEGFGWMKLSGRLVVQCLLLFISQVVSECCEGCSSSQVDL